MPPRGRQAAARREQPLLSNEAARFQSLVIDLGKRTAMDGTLKAAPATVVDELERLFVSMGLQRSLGVSSMLDRHGTPEFWAAVFLVHGYALRDYSALYEEMQQVQEHRQAQRGGATREGGWEGSDSPEWQQLTQSMRRWVGACLTLLPLRYTSCPNANAAFGTPGTCVSAPTATTPRLAGRVPAFAASSSR